MFANYHTHTWRCLHAQGTEREYIERAIEGGLKILGFSDHTPYLFPEGYSSGIRMRPDQLEEYADTILALKKEYQDEIEIRLGLEAEYYPKYWDRLTEFLDDYPIEYLILGQHYLDSETDGRYYSGRKTKDPLILKKYVDQCIEALETGRFLYLAHPELLQFRGEQEVFDREWRRLCRAANRLSIPLEFNFLGLYEERWYPYEAFWKIAAQEQCRMVFGCDAHEPKDVWNPQIEQKALELTGRYGLIPEKSLEIPKRAKR